MKVKIEKMDHLGRGMTYIDNKVCFVPFTVPLDEVEIEITKNAKNYMEGKVLKVLKSDRLDPFCPYFGVCGGCQLQYMSYEDTVKYKKDRISNILREFDIKDIDFIKNKENKYYRNKIELKIQNGIIGFYEGKSHNIIPIKECMITKEAINNFIGEISKMELTSADVTIRCNYNDELLVNIKADATPKLYEDEYPNFKVVGIIYNDKCIYGENHFMEKVGEFFFDVSYDAFFQVNSYINEKLFALIKENVKDGKVLDLYCGVGTLGIVAAKKAKEVYGIEIVPNAVLNAIKNAKINKCDNIHFLMGDAKEKIKYIQNDIDTIIVDPPRKGLDKFVIDKVKEIKSVKIIYISCDTQSLVRDLKEIKDLYDIKKVYAFDMFSYTYHTEVMCVLERK